MPYRWRTDTNGVIHVTGDDGEERIPVLSGDWVNSYNHVDARWRPLVTQVAERWGLMPEWLLAMAWRESGGEPDSHSADGGVGLMQITNPALKGGRTDAQLCDPETSLEIAARFIARDLIPRYGRDFPRVAAAYNAGSVRPSSMNAWGMVCTGSHIDSEVCALNYAIIERMRLEAAELEQTLALVYTTSTMMMIQDTEPRRYS
jgi:hypothetical protein